MFGYVTANKPELKIREFDRYKGYYCGLCHTLLKNHGRRGQWHFFRQYNDRFPVLFFQYLLSKCSLTIVVCTVYAQGKDCITSIQRDFNKGLREDSC